MCKEDNSNSGDDTILANLLLAYLHTRTGRIFVITELPSVEPVLLQEFDCLTQYLVSIKKIESAALTAATTPITDPIFSELMQFIASNPVPYNVISSIMSLCQKKSLPLNALDTNNRESIAVTPLDYAVSRGNLNFITALHEHGEDITALSPSGQSVLHHLIGIAANEIPLEFGEQKNNFVIPFIKLWIGQGLPVDIKNTEGFTPLQIAQEFNLTEICDLLCDTQAPSTSDHTNDSLLATFTPDEDYIS